MRSTPWQVFAYTGFLRWVSFLVVAIESAQKGNAFGEVARILPVESKWPVEAQPSFCTSMFCLGTSWLQGSAALWNEPRLFVPQCVSVFIGSSFPLFPVSAIRVLNSASLRLSSWKRVGCVDLVAWWTGVVPPPAQPQGYWANFCGISSTSRHIECYQSSVSSVWRMTLVIFVAWIVLSLLLCSFPFITALTKIHCF